MFLHGLYGNSKQFEKEQELAAKLGFNSISVTLPGHGPDGKNAGKVKYEDWLKAAEGGMRAAKALGQKVIIVGQSTGGLLAYHLALENSQDVEGLVLAAPAFRVKGYLRAATCAGKEVVANAQDLGRITDIYDPRVKKIKGPISLSMGCEVGRLGDYLLKKHSGRSYLIGSCDEPGRSPSDTCDYTEEAYRKLFVKYDKPILLAHTDNDNTVDQDVNRGLAKFGKNVKVITAESFRARTEKKTEKSLEMKAQGLDGHGSVQNLLTLNQHDFSWFSSSPLKDFFVQICKERVQASCDEYTEKNEISNGMRSFEYAMFEEFAKNASRLRHDLKNAHPSSPLPFRKANFLVLGRVIRLLASLESSPKLHRDLCLRINPRLAKTCEFRKLALQRQEAAELVRVAQDLGIFLRALLAEGKIGEETLDGLTKFRCDPEQKDCAHLDGKSRDEIWAQITKRALTLYFKRITAIQEMAKEIALHGLKNPTGKEIFAPQSSLDRSPTADAQMRAAPVCQSCAK